MAKREVMLPEESQGKGIRDCLGGCKGAYKPCMDGPEETESRMRIGLSLAGFCQESTSVCLERPKKPCMRQSCATQPSPLPI